MNRIEKLFSEKAGDILNVYFTAGFPQKDSTATLLRALSAAGVDLIEVGIPFSDPLADGPTIQASNQQALENGMSLALLLAQVREARTEVETPIILMGYFNQIMQYGEAKFCQDCAAAGVDGLILPDLPPDIYAAELQTLFEKHGLSMTFLVTPQTKEARIREIDKLSKGFIYAVSSAATTGGSSGFQAGQIAYFERLKSMNLQTPHLIGFGVATHADFALCSQYSRGAVVGSAYIRALKEATDLAQATQEFIAMLRGKNQPQA
ncbi:MAG TPA: tryptophan synthase subunit alpha [Bacteroidetes bacterium]|nr:tryptophan synthase subunit alpha [Bacteroidota bacterium]